MKSPPHLARIFAAALVLNTAETRAEVREVIVVYKTHFDIGYTDMAAGIVQRYRTAFVEEALKVADENRQLPPGHQFVWTIPGWPMHKMLEEWPGQTPERRQRVQAALKEGRFALHALPFTTHTELLECEDLVHGLGYAARISRDLALPLPRDAKMTDVPEHAAVTATLLAHAGVTFMHLGCNSMSASPQVPPLYWWEGPDGSRVLTMYSPNYGTGLLPPKDWPHRTWLALLHTGDNHGPPRPEEIENTLTELANRLPAVKVRIGRLSDFGDAILSEKPDLPVVRGEMPDTWIHGPMSDPAGARLARNTRPLIAAAALLNTELRAWGLTVPDAAPAVAAAREQSLLYGEHTWGGSIGWLGGKFGFGEDFKKERAAGRFQRIESSWQEHTGYIEKAQAFIAPVLEQDLRALADAVAEDGPRVVVFNPLPWKRTGLAEVEFALEGIAALQPAGGGDPVPVARRDARIVFSAADVPASGYRTFVPVKAKFQASPLRADAASATIESPSFKAVLDAARGTVASLTDRRSGRELVEPGFGRFLYERFDDARVNTYADAYIKVDHGYRLDFVKPGLPPAGKAPGCEASPGPFQLHVEQTPVSLAAVMEAPAGNGVPCAVTTRLVLYADQTFADLEITLHEKPADPWPEAGWLCLPFKVDAPQFRLGRLGNIVDPARDVIPGSNRHLFGINTGAVIMDAQGTGAGFCPLDSPLVSFDEPGCWKFSKDFVPVRPAAFVNLFNNQWNTNFRLWNSGTWTSRVRLWSCDRYEAGPALVIPSLEARHPFMAAASMTGAGKLPVSRRGVEVSRKGVAVTAFAPNPDGDGILLRIWEQSGTAGDLTITLPDGDAFTSARPVNLRGEPAGDPMPVKSGAFTVPLKPFAPASFVMLSPS